MQGWIKRHKVLSIFLAVLAGIILLLAILGLKPISLSETFTPNPAESYAEALARIEAIQEAESRLPDLSEECATLLMTHDEKVENAIVFLHGFTSCPDQFRQLGEEYFNQGYNVYIPRQPRHGLTDHTGDPLKGLTAEELARFGTETADIAHGLGDRVIISGLSGGGSISTWLAQERSDIDLAAPISPFLGIGFIPKILTRPVTNLILLIPDIYQWWDPIQKMDNPLSAPYSYRGYWMHALFQNLRLGFAAKGDARKTAPAAESIVLITNANDQSVNNGVVADFKQTWDDQGASSLQSFEFSRDLRFPHDMITYARPDGQPEVVYPQLMQLIR